MSCGKVFKVKGLQCTGCYNVMGHFCVALDVGDLRTRQAVIAKDSLVLDVLFELFIHIENVMVGTKMKDAISCWGHKSPMCHELARQTLQSSYSTDSEKTWAEKVLGGQNPYPSHGNQVSPRETQDNSGFIYILSGGGYFKIGLTTNITRRISEIEPRLPFTTELMHTIHVKDMYIAEEYLHEKFAHKRSNGEWFKLDDADIAWIEKWDGKLNESQH